MHLIKNISQLITMAPLAKRPHFSKIERADLGCLSDAWICVADAKVFDYGTGDCPHEVEQVTDAKQKMVMPGLIDCHTHPVFAGSRANEFCKRLEGETYQQIAKAGGGIKATVKWTREASDEELLNLTQQRLRKFLSYGVTTVEMKSGYGLSVSDELRLLRVLKRAGELTPQTTSVTCLALHAVPPEVASKSAYIAEMTETLLPKVKKEDLAQWVDAFVEEGYFLPQEIESHIKKAKELGFGIRIHADEFKDSGAAKAAAEWEAASADHVEEASDKGIAAMADKGVVAVLLPGTSLYCAMKYTQAERFRNLGCEIALATDFNPGSCVIDNLPLVATLGALHCKLSPAETVASVTLVAAKALKLHAHKGALAKGYDADLLLSSLNSIDDFVADFGRNPPSAIMVAGQFVEKEKLA